jgi:CRISPR/Cas system-associated exonuclease Cas4 (RecB family)
MIGILPSDDWREANAHVSVPVATGIGEARNAVIATAGFALVAVSGREEPVSYGTISEMAFGPRLGRLMVGMAVAPDLPGVARCCNASEAAEIVAARYLSLA